MNTGVFGVLRDIAGYLAERKKYLLAPMFIILLLMALFAIGAEIPVLTPFIYALF